MKRASAILAAILFLPLLTAADWLQFRGSDQSGLALDAQLPPAIGEENVAWKAPLPGKGVSGPIVVGERVYVTASQGPVVQDRLLALCYSAKDGKQLWRREFWATGRCFHHPTSAVAAPTPCSDGQRIFAFYSSNDLVCLDLDGNLLWYRGLGDDYPKAGNDVGMASSPIVVDETVVVQVENQGDSFAAGIDVATGETRWRVARKAGANWTSPSVLYGKDGKNLVLLQSSDGLTAYEPKSGEQVWKYETSCSGIPSTTTAEGRIYLPAKGLTALSATPADSAAELAWESNRLGPGSASPVVRGDKVYVLPRAGVLTCGSVEDGEVLWQVRLKGTFWATPVIAGQHLYCINQDGQCLVVNLAGEKGELVSTAEFGETFMGSPAVGGNALYLRGDKHLWKIASPK